MDMGQQTRATELTQSVLVDTSLPTLDEEVHLLQAIINVLALAIKQWVKQRGSAGEKRRQIIENLHEILTILNSNRTLDNILGIALSDQASLAIENARLIATAQDQAILEERQRLARDLHDSVIQSLYGITLHAQAARRLLAAGEVASAIDSLGVLQETAQETLDEMRLLIFDLRPPILEQVGLVAALQARLNAVEGRANLQTKLIVDGVTELPPLVEQALYRIAQEALNNALKHAYAKCIMVQLYQAQTDVILEITDDGVGFELAVASQMGGSGLRGLSERVAQLGGQLTVRSALGTGTQVRVEIVL